MVLKDLQNFTRLAGGKMLQAGEGLSQGREAVPCTACLVLTERMVQGSDITACPAVLEPKLSGTRMRKDGLDCPAGVSLGSTC